MVSACFQRISPHFQGFLKLLAVWWMRVGIDSLLSSHQVFLWDLKRISTPHKLFRDFGADVTITTRWSGGRVQVQVQVSPCLSSGNHPRRLFQKTKANGQKTKAYIDHKASSLLSLALRAALRHSLGWSDRRAQTQCIQVGGSCCWPQQARLKETCYHSYDTEKILMLCKFWVSNESLFLM